MQIAAQSTGTDRLAFLDAILATLPEAVAIVRLDQKLMELNPAGLALLGAASLDDIPDEAPLSLISRKHIPRFKAHFGRALTKHSDNLSDPLILEIQALDGETRFLECRMAPLKDADDTLAGVVVTARNVSDREHDLHSVKEYAALLSAILATVPDPMIVIDDQGIVTSFSATAEVLFGYSEKEMLGQKVDILMPAPYQASHDGFMQQFLQTGEKRIIGQGRIVEGMKKDGSLFPMELTVGEANARNHRAFTGFIRDQTEKYEAEAQLHLLQTELLHASRLSAIGTLASALAHELNQPLAAIANYMAAGRDLVDDANPAIASDLREAFDEARKEAMRAGLIIQRLRDFVAKRDIDTQILSLDKLINDATTLGLIGAREKGVACSIEVEPDITDVLADRVQIQQVIVNLIRNAIEAMEDVPSKFLAIHARSVDSNHVKISVIDNGTGVSDDLMGGLFQPFVSNKPQGMGLGLTICRTIIEAHGGQLTVAPNPSGGTIFSFTLPRVSQEMGHGG